MVVGGMGGKGTEDIKPHRFRMEPDRETSSKIIITAQFILSKGLLMKLD
jgi:hypothetical protein